MTPSGSGAAPVIAAHGVTQIIGYGTLYYAFAILAPQIAAEFKVSEAALFAILLVGLLLGGMATPAFGHWMDRFGAPVIMSAGSALMALLLVLLAFAPGISRPLKLLCGHALIGLKVQEKTVMDFKYGRCDRNGSKFDHDRSAIWTTDLRIGRWWVGHDMVQ